MKRVLFLAPFDSMGRFNGGIASYARSISEDPLFKNENIEFIPLSTSRVKRDAYSGGKFTLKNIVNFFKTKKALKHELKNGSINSIYINSSRNYALFKDLLLFKKRYVGKYEMIVHIHFAEFDEVFANNKFVRKKSLSILKNIVTKIIVLSNVLKDELIKHGVSGDKIYVLRNYFDSSLQIDSNIALVPFNKPNQTTYLFVGSITRRKGIDYLLSVFGDLDDIYQLNVCGSPNDPYGDELVKKYESRNNIHFLGFVNGEQKQKAFRNADVFVLPTLAEGLPISILEAMASGLGIITTSVGAIPEIIKKQNGFVIKPSDKEALLQAIKNYHDNPDLLLKHKKENLEDSVNYSYPAFRINLIRILKDEK